MAGSPETGAVQRLASRQDDLWALISVKTARRNDRFTDPFTAAFTAMTSKSRHTIAMSLLELSSICLSCLVFASAAMYLPQLPCIASAAIYLPQLPIIRISCHVFSSAVILLSRLACISLVWHVLGSAVMYLPQLPWNIN